MGLIGSERVSRKNQVWCAGFDGQLWDGGKEEWAQLTWHPGDLKVGGPVGLG